MKNIKSLQKIKIYIYNIMFKTSSKNKKMVISESPSSRKTNSKSPSSRKTNSRTQSSSNYLKKIPLKNLRSRRLQKNIKTQKSKRQNEINKRRIKNDMYKSFNRRNKKRINTKKNLSSSKSLGSPNITSNNGITNNINLQSGKVHYIVAVHGNTRLDKKVIIPKYNNTPFSIKLYIQKGNILVYEDMEKEAGNICNNNEKVSVFKEILKSGDEVEDMDLENDIPNKFGVYVCQNDSIIKYIPLNFEITNLLGLISVIFDINNKENNSRSFKMSLLSCRGYETKEKKEQHYEFIEKIDPNVELSTSLKDMNLFKSLKKWKFTEDQYVKFKPVECSIDKSKQYGCALQTLLFLGEIEETKELKDEIFNVSKNRKPTAQRITTILNNKYNSLYDTMLDENYTYKTFPVSLGETRQGYRYFISDGIRLICNSLKNYEATLIKLNRAKSNVSHVVCLLKKNNICRFVDPQQVLEYQIEDFTDFAMSMNVSSFSVLFEKDPDFKR